MKAKVLPAILFVLAFAVAATAQDATSAAPPSQSPSQSSGQGGGGWQGRRSGGGGFGGGMGAGRGLLGTVTEVTANHYTIKTDAGESYTVNFSANTHILKQLAQRPGGGPEERGGGNQRMPPQPLKPTDIKVGDPIIAIGQVDAPTKSVGAVAVLLVDPERAQRIRELEGSYGKTWLMGKVTGVDGVKVTLMGAVDNAPHTFVADENTSFRKRREPITLADIQVGDTMRAEGAIKEGVFVAATVSVMGMGEGGGARVPRDSPPAAAPPAPPQ